MAFCCLEWGEQTCKKLFEADKKYSFPLKFPTRLPRVWRGENVMGRGIIYSKNAAEQSVCCKIVLISLRGWFSREKLLMNEEEYFWEVI